ncbi:peptide chain release factor N(5)-glutamine methyltransferase [Lepagella muris]|mgnify:FL=1|uniref:Peptide chain release factor N(5)-glutamine methyltransferase n=1 Tax=Lepagella muris TaxID=3032870 RepID=A0AC61RI54_9BACT|nr:peptide chain release factor N(5)-glutamine methyltransferase [Lepagella muris]ROT06532.1 peptide chain release factor N(5)-glutamine methyltransferase [Muribaculaceae bacterium Isolate-037 (Harlan)]TGY80849.1 peptide chain release factor N(5)-glutamine methyltransferase [Lepagella muris]THG53927.1 peptide chain release factor N(5)-glutamine methyltransferase [Bacteroidales bacterium]TKC59697.1 peptide chain release factor N(5)-glutamine methyltransferase [Bacteroidales bacterium]
MRDTLRKLREILRPLYGNGETEAIIRIMFHYLKGWNTVDIIMHEDASLSPFIKSEIDAILKRLVKHEPIQYITGEARFHGMEMKVTPDVLIPRPETDELVDIIVSDAGETEDLRVLDIGTGSGCIAIALARSLRFPTVTAVDISDAALAVARENASNLKANVSFIKEDILTVSPEGIFDIIVSNPPYIDESEKSGMEPNVLDYEPKIALFVPDDNPLLFYKRIAEIAVRKLSPAGKLYFEINPRHADELSRYLTDCGFDDVQVIRDSFGKLRFIKATNNANL